MQTLKQFGVWPMIMMMTLSVGLVNHVVIIPLLLDAAKRDAWLSVLCAVLPVILWAWFPLTGIVRSMNGAMISDWLGDRVSAAGKWMFLLPFVLLLVFTSYHSLVDAVLFSNTTYTPYTPSVVVTLLYVAMCTYGALAGLRTIAFISCILLPFVVVLGDFVMSANMPHKDYKFLLPIAEHGFGSIMEGSLYSFSALIELYMLILIQPHLRGRIGKSGLAVLIAFLALLTLGPVSAAIAEFGPEEARNLRYPAFSQWRLVSIGNYIEHLDFFAIYQWMSGSFVRISMTLYLASEIMFRTRKARTIGTLAIALMLGIATEIAAGRQVLYQVVLRNYFHYSGIVILLLTIVLWAISASRSRPGDLQNGQKGGEQHEPDKRGG